MESLRTELKLMKWTGCLEDDKNLRSSNDEEADPRRARDALC